MKKINIIDMFCGGGGESTGLISAAHEYAKAMSGQILKEMTA